MNKNLKKYIWNRLPGAISTIKPKPWNHEGNQYYYDFHHPSGFSPSRFVIGSWVVDRRRGLHLVLHLWLWFGITDNLFVSICALFLLSGSLIQSHIVLSVTGGRPLFFHMTFLPSTSAGPVPSLAPSRPFLFPLHGRPFLRWGGKLRFPAFLVFVVAFLLLREGRRCPDERVGQFERAKLQQLCARTCKRNCVREELLSQARSRFEQSDVSELE